MGYEYQIKMKTNCTNRILSLLLLAVALSLVSLLRLVLIIKTQQKQTNRTTTTTKSCDHQFHLGPILNLTKEHYRENYDPPCSHVFYPVDFFEKQNSPGFLYKEHLIDLLSQYTIVQIGVHMSTIEYPVSDVTPTKDEKEVNATNGYVYVPFDLKSNTLYLFYNSIPKAGTTSIIKAMKDMAMISEDFKINTNIQYHGMVSNKWLQHEYFSVLNSSAPSAQVKIFSVVRDPVSRFVSAVGQEMHYTARHGKDFRDKCLLNTGKETVQCAIDHVKSRIALKKLDQIHFFPAAVPLYLRMTGVNLPVEIIDFQDIDKVTNELRFGAGPIAKQNDHTSTRKSAGSDVLETLSVSDLSEDMIIEICRIYAPDLLIMQHLKMEDKYCKNDFLF